MPRRRNKKVLLICDVGEDFAPGKKLPRHPDWVTERDVEHALKAEGYVLEWHFLRDSLEGLTEKIRDYQPELIFNLTEAFRGYRDLEGQVVSVFELMGVRHTGASSEVLQICRDKALSKKLVSFHGVAIPSFVVVRNQRLRKLEIKFPAVVKPIDADGSEGINQKSLVRNSQEAWERIFFLQSTMGCDAIVEEYIAGREIYVGVLATNPPSVFHPVELYFGKMKGRALMATVKVKFDPKYRRKYGMRFRQVREPELVQKLKQATLQCVEALKLTGYARIDFRVRADNTVVFIEANPNPSLAKADDFAHSAQQAGINYPALIQKIIGTSRSPI